MSPREAFKFGFLARCAEEGLTPSQAQERVKTAAARKQAILGININPLGILEGAAATGAIGAVGLGAGAGLAGSYGLAKVQDPGYDADAIKRQELMTAYGTLTDDLDEQRNADKELAEGEQ